MLATLQGLGCSAESVYRLLEILNPLGRLHVVSRLHLPYFTERSVVHISNIGTLTLTASKGANVIGPKPATGEKEYISYMRWESFRVES